MPVQVPVHVCMYLVGSRLDLQSAPRRRARRARAAGARRGQVDGRRRRVVTWRHMLRPRARALCSLACSAAAAAYRLPAGARTLGGALSAAAATMVEPANVRLEKLAAAYLWGFNFFQGCPLHPIFAHIPLSAARPAALAQEPRSRRRLQTRERRPKLSAARPPSGSGGRAR